MISVFTNFDVIVTRTVLQFVLFFWRILGQSWKLKTHMMDLPNFEIFSEIMISDYKGTLNVVSFET